MMNVPDVFERAINLPPRSGMMNVANVFKCAINLPPRSGMMNLANVFKCAINLPPRSGLMNLAVGFNPRLQAKKFLRRVATVDPSEEKENMANTYTALYYHIVFSTKNRVTHIKPEVESRVWAYIGGVARAHKMTALQVGGIEDHIHALVMAPATLSRSQIAQYLKGDSSK